MYYDNENGKDKKLYQVTGLEKHLKKMMLNLVFMETQIL